MKLIAIPTRDGSVDDHFGHCAYYTIYHLDDDGKVVIVERLDSPQGCGCKSNIAAVMREMGVSLMLAGNMGEGAFSKLSEQGIQVVRGCHGKVEAVLNQYLGGNLKDSQESCAHHDCHGSDENLGFTYVMPK